MTGFARGGYRLLADRKGREPHGVLEVKGAIVTGAGNGISRSMALTLARNGEAVVVNDNEQAAADDVVAEIVSVGTRRREPRRRVGMEVRTGDGRAGGTGVRRLDIVVAHAGIVGRSGIVDVSAAHLNAQVAALRTGTYGLLYQRAHCEGRRESRHGHARSS